MSSTSGVANAASEIPDEILLTIIELALASSTASTSRRTPLGCNVLAPLWVSAQWRRVMLDPSLWRGRMMGLRTASLLVSAGVRPHGGVSVVLTPQDTQPDGTSDQFPALIASIGGSLAEFAKTVASLEIHSHHWSEPALNRALFPLDSTPVWSALTSLTLEGGELPKNNLETTLTANLPALTRLAIRNVSCAESTLPMLLRVCTSLEVLVFHPAERATLSERMDHARLREIDCGSQLVAAPATFLFRLPSIEVFHWRGLGVLVGVAVDDVELFGQSVAWAGEVTRNAAPDAIPTPHLRILTGVALQLRHPYPALEIVGFPSSMLSSNPHDVEPQLRATLAALPRLRECLVSVGSGASEDARIGLQQRLKFALVEWMLYPPQYRLRVDTIYLGRHEASPWAHLTVPGSRRGETVEGESGLPNMHVVIRRDAEEPELFCYDLVRHPA